MKLKFGFGLSVHLEITFKSGDQKLPNILRDSLD